MSTITITGCPFGEDRPVPINYDLMGDGSHVFLNCKIAGTFDFTILESSFLSKYYADADRETILADQSIQLIPDMVNSEAQLTLAKMTDANPITKESLPALVKKAQEEWMAMQAPKYEERLDIAINALNYTSIVIFDRQDQAICTWQARSQTGQWTCEYCGSINDAKFCPNCGAPRH